MSYRWWKYVYTLNLLSLSNLIGVTTYWYTLSTFLSEVASSSAHAKNGEAPGTRCLRMCLISPRCGDSGLFSDSSVSCDVEFGLDIVWNESILSNKVTCGGLFLRTLHQRLPPSSIFLYVTVVMKHCGITSGCPYHNTTSYCTHSGTCGMLQWWIKVPLSANT